MKRTPLNRGESKLAPRSKKTAKLYKDVRIPLVKELLEERPVCERCERRPSVDVHERLTRGRSGGVRGTAWLDKDNLVALCRICHNEVTADPDGALEEGWVEKDTGLDTESPD